MLTAPAAPVSRLSARPPSAALNSAGAILVYHPHYTRPTILMRLEVYPIRGSPVAGVPLALVVDACQVVANNARGYLTLYGEQTEIVLRSDAPGDLLRPGKYHYRVPSHTSGPYPICLTFRAWDPPVAAPQNWARQRWAPPGTDVTVVDTSVASTVWSNLSHDVKRMDGRCAVTGDRSRLDASHLVPRAESVWFNYHRLAAALDGGFTVDNSHNLITLRADLKRATFDEGHFVFFPYQGKVVTIFMTTGTCDLAHEFHFRAAEIPGRILPEYLYARFAWSIFKIAWPWLRAYENDTEVIKVAVLAALQPTPIQPPQGKKRKWEGPEDAAKTSNERSGDTRDEDAVTDEDSSLQTDAERALDVYSLTDADIARAEARDAELQLRQSHVLYDDDPHYPGYSKALRLRHEYRRQHPEVSAVRNAQIGRVGDATDE
ncbi:hypothetical protein B0H11DRAFT_1903114 [Mycena galericulata]|nr:hypothetical protein B0H11DRAFT_1903114 [Mycena galericulata]